MLRKNIIYNCIIVLLIILYSVISSTLAYAEGEGYIDVWHEQKTILIDPGHGGMDGGAISKTGSLEKDINLKIALRLKLNLEAEGYKVVMTRDEDQWLAEENGSIRKRKIEDLANRNKLKYESGCDMFISVHLNSFPQSKYYGAQVWYSNNTESKVLARLLQQSFKNNLDKDNKRIEKCSKNTYVILKNSGALPAVIAECGFLSNVQEAEKLETEEYQDKISNAIVQAVNMYYGEEKD